MQSKQGPERQDAQTLVSRRRAAAPPLRRVLVSTAFATMRSTGAFSVLGRTAGRNRGLIILCYHGVSLQDEHEWRPDLYISEERLAARLRCLQEAKVTVLPFSEAITRLKAGTLPPKSATITFDDGFHDFSMRAAPVLNQFGYPATVYLTTHYVKHQLPVPNLMLDYLLWKSKHNTLLLPEYGIDAPMNINDLSSRQEAVQKVSKYMDSRRLDSEGKNQILSQIAGRLGLEYEEVLASRVLQLMSPSEVQTIARSGFAIELHTHRHRMPEDRAQFAQEIEENRSQIRELSGKEPVHFCYPSGQYSDTFARWLVESGVQSATTCERAMARRNSNPMFLPRVLDDSLQEESRFYGVVNGVVL
ncbi:MAG: polysaccharide deacetylase family protein [Acidobacteriaceae bacterium]|nr:polysaccharide deacetylase family protein [Acidobacteriaceae bacterium]